jgi:hypothetical protein
MVRKIGAVIAGLAVVGVMVATLQWISAGLYPLPEGVDPMDPADADAFARYLATLPVAGWAIAFGSELLGGFFGALTAGWIARDQPRVFSGVIVGAALLGSLFNWSAFPHPTWFMIGQLIGYPIALMGVWTVLGRREVTPDA